MSKAIIRKKKAAGAPVESNLPAAPQEIMTRPGELSIAEVKGQVDKIKKLMEAVMVGPTDENPGGVHYGVIPGTNKPTLLQPGAQKLCMLFRLRAIIAESDITITEFEGGHREYRIACHLYDNAGLEVATGLGSCSTMEGKYRYRWENTNAQVPREYWNARDKRLIGGDTFTPRKAWIEDSNGKRFQSWMIFQRVEHDNPADYYNTALKMAKKRALVDGTIMATASSELFTQDVEDMDENFKAAGRRAFDDGAAAGNAQGGQRGANPRQEQARGDTARPDQKPDEAPKPRVKHEIVQAHIDLEKAINAYCANHPERDPIKVLQLITSYTNGSSVVAGVSEVALLDIDDVFIARRKLEGLANAGRDFRQELSKSILDYCLGNPDTDKLIVLQDLTGQKDFRYVTPELAQKGLEKFNKEYKQSA